MRGDRWLDEREARGWRGFLAMQRALERGLDRQLSTDASLSAADYQLLVPLSEAPDMRLRARELGRTVEWERSRLSHQLRRMEHRGLIARSNCPTDARGTIIELTDEGLQAIETAAPPHVAWVREHFVDLLSEEELDALAVIADKVLASLAAEGTCDAEDALCEETECDAALEADLAAE